MSHHTITQSPKYNPATGIAVKEAILNVDSASSNLRNELQQPDDNECDTISNGLNRKESNKKTINMPLPKKLCLQKNLQINLRIMCANRFGETEELSKNSTADTVPRRETRRLEGHKNIGMSSNLLDGNDASPQKASTDFEESLTDDSEEYFSILFGTDQVISTNEKGGKEMNVMKEKMLQDVTGKLESGPQRKESEPGTLKTEETLSSEQRAAAEQTEEHQPRAREPETQGKGNKIDSDNIKNERSVLKGFLKRWHNTNITHSYPGVEILHNGPLDSIVALHDDKVQPLSSSLKNSQLLKGASQDGAHVFQLTSIENKKTYEGTGTPPLSTNQNVPGKLDITPQKKQVLTHAAVQFHKHQQPSGTSLMSFLHLRAEKRTAALEAEQLQTKWERNVTQLRMRDLFKYSEMSLSRSALLEAENKGLRLTLAKLRIEEAQLKGKIIKLEMKVTLQATSQKATEMAVFRKFSEKSLEEQLNEKTRELEKAQQAIAELQNEFYLLETELEHEREAHEQYQLRTKQMERQHEHLQAESETALLIKEDLARQLRISEERVTELEADFEGFYANIKLWEHKHSKAWEKSKQLQNKLIQTQTAQEELQCQKASLERQNKELRLQVKKLENSRQCSWEMRLLELEDQLHTEEKEKAVLLGLVHKMEKNVQELTQEINDDRQQFEEDRNQLFLRIKTLKQQLIESEEEIDRLDAHCRRDRREFQEQEELSEQLTMQISKLQKQLKYKEVDFVTEMFERMNLRISLENTLEENEELFEGQ
uniref:cingulin-like protein 1 n=1 Tax=Pristiophorus japonicus TaxID=55135 RepID=UPI00398ECA40